MKKINAMHHNNTVQPQILTQMTPSVTYIAIMLYLGSWKLM